MQLNPDHPLVLQSEPKHRYMNLTKSYAKHDLMRHEHREALIRASDTLLLLHNLRASPSKPERAECIAVR